jgi:hypothetical protein
MPQNNILRQNFSKKLNFLDGRWCACGQVMKKKYENFFFNILKITEERSRIRSWIQKSEVRIRIRTKMSRIANTALFLSGVPVVQQVPGSPDSRAKRRASMERMEMIKMTPDGKSKRWVCIIHCQDDTGRLVQEVSVHYPLSSWPPDDKSERWLCIF